MNISINSGRARGIFRAIMAASLVWVAAGFSQGPLTAQVPVKVNVDAIVSIEPTDAAYGEGETKFIAKDSVETFNLEFRVSTSVSHNARRLSSAPVSVSQGHGSVSLTLRSDAYMNARVSLFSINGKRVMHDRISGSAASRISRQNLAKGVYLLSVNGAKGNAFTSRIIHEGGRLDISVSNEYGNPYLARQTAEDYGTWTITATPAVDGYKDTSYTFSPVAGLNDSVYIELEREYVVSECTPSNRNPGIVTYAARGSRNLVMRISLPEGSGPWPVIMYIHGGIWQGTDGQPGSAGNLNGVGRTNPYALAEITYTYANNNPPSYPAAVEDVLAAVRFLRANAAQYCIDPNRIIAAGHSSGGYFANMVGTLSSTENHTFTNASLGNYPEVSSEVQAWIAVSGLTDLSKLYEQNGNQAHCTQFNQPFMGFNICEPTTEQAETLKWSNPLEYVTCATLPPAYLLHGTDDGVVPVGQAQLLKDKIESQCSGHNLEYVTSVRGGMMGHGEPTAAEAIAIFNWLDGIFYP